jgi:hypothetical protein
MATGISFRCILEMALTHARSGNRVQPIQTTSRRKTMHRIVTFATILSLALVSAQAIAQ